MSVFVKLLHFRKKKKTRVLSVPPHLASPFLKEVLNFQVLTFMCEGDTYVSLLAALPSFDSLD
jgi:hypothetical protein